MVCSESTLALASVALGYLRHEPSWYLFAVLPAVFSVWGWIEMPAAAAATAAGKAAASKRK